MAGLGQRSHLPAQSERPQLLCGQRCPEAEPAGRAGGGDKMKKPLASEGVEDLPQEMKTPQEASQCLPKGTKLGFSASK